METEKGLHILQQDSFVEETGLPRWGCMFMAFLGALQFFFNRALKKDEIMHIYWDVRKTFIPWNKKPVLGMETNNYELALNDPSELLQLACSYMSPDHAAIQFPDIHCHYPESVPGKFECQYILKKLDRGNRDGHWVTAEATPSFTTIYNPLVSCTGPWTGYWRGVKIWAK